MDVSRQSVEAAFRPAIEEIQRRKASAEINDCDEVLHFTRDPDAPDLPLHLPNQSWALVTMGTAVLAPRPLDPTAPALRIYGTFATREEAAEHAQDVRRVDEECSLIAVRTHEWILMPQTKQTRDDPVENQRCVDALLEFDALKRADEAAEFNIAVAEKRAAEEIKGLIVDEEALDMAEAEASVYKPPRRLRNGGEVRGQSHVALCVVRDPEGQCVIKILGTFENATEADAWVKNVASKTIYEHNIHVVATCEWVYPNAEHEHATKTRYRNDELQRIMDAADRNHKSVQDYKEWMRESESKTIEEIE